MRKDLKTVAGLPAEHHTRGMNELEPALPGDLPVLLEHMRRMRLDTERAEASQFRVLRREGRIVAFGRIKPYQELHELGSVGVLEEARGQGLGVLVVKDLVERFPTPEVWIATDLVAFFEPLGFRVVSDPPRELLEKLEQVCAALRSGVVVMKLVRGSVPGTPDGDGPERKV